MSDGQGSPSAISDAGIVAAAVLERPGLGRIVAVSERSLYGELDGRLFCIGGPEIGRGPLNAIAVPAVADGWPELGICDGASLLVEPTRLLIAQGLALDLSGLTRWVPPDWPRRPAPEDLGAAIAHLRELAGDRLPPTGIAPIVFGRRQATGIQGAFARRATLAFAMLQDWLESALDHDADAARIATEAVGGLIGMGPGLTPSGDDFLVGVSLALHALGLRETTAALGRAVRAAPPDATSPISRAHLNAALDGHPGETAHDVICALMTGKASAFPSLLGRVDAIGHCSGWDTLAGITVALAAAGRHSD